MKTYLLRAFAFILLSAILALNVGLAAHAQDFPPDDWQGGAEGGWYVNVDIDDPLNIRSLPSHKSVKVGIVKRGVEVNILDTAENGWRFIETDTISGWVNGIYLAARPPEAINVRPVPTAANLPTKPTVMDALPTKKIVVPPTASNEITDFNNVAKVDLSIMEQDAETRLESSDQWLPYDYYYLVERPKALNGPAVLVLSLSNTPNEMKLIEKSMFGYVSKMNILVRQHPNWSLPDYLLELNNEPFLELNDHKRKFISYLFKYKVDDVRANKREKYLDRTLNSCLKFTSSLRPTLRPERPHKNCAALILTTNRF